MIYYSCIKCGEAKTEFEISHLGLPYCERCGADHFTEGIRPHSFKNWLLHPFELWNYLQQEKQFKDFNA